MLKVGLTVASPTTRRAAASAIAALEGHSEALLRLGSYQLRRLRGFLNEAFEMSSLGLRAAAMRNQRADAVAQNESDQQQHPRRRCNNFHGGNFPFVAALTSP
jgi:hypothetical protein